MSLEQIKEIAKNMPECKEKQKALTAYNNLNVLEVIAKANPKEL